MPKIIIVTQGLVELLGLGAFLAGYFADIWWLMMAGGILVVLDDILEMAMGILNPLFPLLLAVALAVVLAPWYVGVFWASAAFKVLGIPTSLLKVAAPEKVLARVKKQTGYEENI